MLNPKSWVERVKGDQKGRCRHLLSQFEHHHNHHHHRNTFHRHKKEDVASYFHKCQLALIWSVSSDIKLFCAAYPGFSLDRCLKTHLFDSLFLHSSPKRHFAVKRRNLSGLAPLMRKRCYRPRRHNGTSLHFTQSSFHGRDFKGAWPLGWKYEDKLAGCLKTSVANAIAACGQIFHFFDDDLFYGKPNVHIL